MKVDQGHFRITFPLDGASIWRCERISITDDFILIGLIGRSYVMDQEKGRHTYILLFDRWTLQLVNSLTVKHAHWHWEIMRIVEDGNNTALLIDFYSMQENRSKAFLWHM